MLLVNKESLEPPGKKIKYKGSKMFFLNIQELGNIVFMRSCRNRESKRKKTET